MTPHTKTLLTECSLMMMSHGWTPRDLDVAVAQAQADAPRQRRLFSALLQPLRELTGAKPAPIARQPLSA